MKNKAAIFVFVISLFIIDISKARADLLITPLRAVFEGRERSQIITLINTSDKTHTYRMGWQLLKMQESGSYEVVETFTDSEGQDLSAVKMLRFSPRQVTIDPQGRQRIRLSLRRSGELQDGEYRAHLTFTRLAKDTPLDTSQFPERGQSVILQTNLAFSIPIIVRQGKAIPSVAIESPEFFPAQGKDPRPRLSVRLKLSSNFSSFGRLRAYWQKPRGGEEEIGVLNNVSVFPEIEKRSAFIPLTKTNFASGRVRVVYEGLEEYAGVVFDEQVFNLQ